MHILCDYWSLELNEKLQKICSFYGGGIGRSGCICGALVGALNTVALRYGEIRNDSDSKAYSYAKKLYDYFISHNKSSCCKILRDNFTKPSTECKERIYNLIQFCMKEFP